MIRRNLRSNKYNLCTSPNLPFNDNHREQQEIESRDTDSSDGAGEVLVTYRTRQQIRTDQLVSRWTWMGILTNWVLSVVLYFLIIFYKIAMLFTAVDFWIAYRVGQFHSVQILRRYWDYIVYSLLVLPILYLLTIANFVDTENVKDVSFPSFELLNFSSPLLVSIAQSTLYIFYNQSQKSVQKEEFQWNPSSETQKDHSSSDARREQFSSEDHRSLVHVQKELEKLRDDIKKLFRLFEEQKLTKEKERKDSNSIAEKMRLLEQTILQLKNQLSLSSEQNKESEEQREERIWTILLKLWEDKFEEKMVPGLKKIFPTKVEFLPFVNLTLELKQTVSDLKSERTELRNEVTYSEEELLRVVKQELTLYDADKLGLVDYALESSGGSVSSTRCSETFTRYSPQIYVWGWPIWMESPSPRLVIQPGRQPGECWPFAGSEGYLVIRLSHPIIPNAFSLEHVPASISPKNSVLSAPKHFSAWGLKSEMDPGVLLGKYFYDVGGTSLQTFPVETNNSEEFNLIEFKIHSNHGHNEFTCVYRLRVHGVPKD